jgi:hypothetical protein
MKGVLCMLTEICDIIRHTCIHDVIDDIILILLLSLMTDIINYIYYVEHG